MCVAATELILLAAAAFLIKFGLDRWRPGRMRGWASCSRIRHRPDASHWASRQLVGELSNQP